MKAPPEIKSEFEWLAAIQKILGPARRAVVGIGDDAAVLPASSHPLAVTVDAMVEGVHFDLAYCLPEDVGHKALAMNESDLHAMAARPRFAVVSVVLPAEKAAAFLPGFYQGLAERSRTSGVEIVGGNLSHTSGPVSVSITLFGDQVRSPLLRQGARPGDQLGILGTLGEAAAGLWALRALGREAAQRRYGPLVQAQLRPGVRVPAGWESLGATSAMDVSDGLSSELHHLARASGVSFELDRAALALPPLLRQAAGEAGVDPFEWVLHGGEDYALLFTAPSEIDLPSRLPGAVCIGRVHPAGTPAVWEGSPARPVLPRGHDHFA